jgi:hypothetical protein
MRVWTEFIWLRIGPVAGTCEQFHWCVLIFYLSFCHDSCLFLFTFLLLILFYFTFVRLSQMDFSESLKLNASFRKSRRK